MGCIGSKERRWRAYAAEPPVEFDLDETNKALEHKAQSSRPQAPESGKQPGSGNIVNIHRPKLDPKDFQFVNCKGETKIKPPGSINGQSFMIDKCENCDIYILDHCGQVTLDECKDCRVYVGPTDGAVFIRDSARCNLAVVCRQLRTRDCIGCNIALYCRSKPIVESSNNMGFSCLDLSYPQLRDHMRHAKLSSFHNFWYDIFDFTPKEANWRLLPPDTTAATLLEPIPAEVAELLRNGQEEAAEQSPLLLTKGSALPQLPATAAANNGGLSYLFILFEGAKHEQALQLARTAVDKGWLLRTNEARLSAAAAAAIAADAGWSKAVAKELSGGTGNAGCVGLELGIPSGGSGGSEAQAAALALASQLGGHASSSEAAGKAFRTAGLDG